MFTDALTEEQNKAVTEVLCHLACSTHAELKDLEKVRKELVKQILKINEMTLGYFESK